MKKNLLILPSYGPIIDLKKPLSVIDENSKRSKRKFLNPFSSIKKIKNEGYLYIFLKNMVWHKMNSKNSWTRTSFRGCSGLKVQDVEDGKEGRYKRKDIEKKPTTNLRIDLKCTCP